MAVLFVHCAGNARLVVFAFIWNSRNNSYRVLVYNREGLQLFYRAQYKCPQFFKIEQESMLCGSHKVSWITANGCYQVPGCKESIFDTPQENAPGAK